MFLARSRGIGVDSGSAADDTLRVGATHGGIGMASNAREVYKSSQRCPRTGIFRVIHDPEHTAAHEVTMLFGEAFPSCNQCGQAVRFELVRSARYYLNDPNFWAGGKPTSSK